MPTNKVFSSEQIKQGFSQFKTEADNAYVSQDSFDTDANIIELVDDIFVEYSIATSVTNGSYSGSTTIKKLNGTATVTITANEGYGLPSTITVNGVTGVSGSTGVTWSYNTTTGEIELSNATGNVTITMVCVSLLQYCTVTGLGSSSPSTVTFAKSSNFTLQGLGIEEVTTGGDTFIKIPTMYRKVNTVSSNQITSFTISNVKVDNDYYPYPCFIKEDGETVMPYVLIGKYWNTSSTSCISTTAASATSNTLAVGRTRAVARGTGYQLFDWMMHKLWQDLIICFKETVNTNSGSGIGTDGYDDLAIYWGGSSSQIDGVLGSSGTWRFSYKPSEYVSLSAVSDAISSTYESASYSQPTSNDEIQKLGYDNNNPFFNYPSGVVRDNNNSTYYCDSYYYRPYNRPINFIVGNNQTHSGVFRLLFSDGNSEAWSTEYPVRLCYRPINN